MVIAVARAGMALHVLAAGGLALLGGCISSGAPLLGERPLLQFYALHDGAAEGPSTETFRWRDGRYVPTGGTASDIGPFTLNALSDDTMTAQSVLPGHPSEYAVVHKVADGTYFMVAVDENDADEATRAKYCSTDERATCRVTTPEAVLAFARATAAKPRSAGGLAVLIAEP